MGWSYPKISFEDFMNLIKSYVDLLLLASGYQSTGLVANWDSENIKKSLQWALFLEEVSKGLLSSADYEDSVEELDSLLYELTLDPNFPQDLAQLSCITLCRARDLMLEHLIHTFPMRESHLKAIMIASLEMDNSTVPSKERDNWEDGDFSVATIQQLKKRKLAVSCSSAAEAGLENIWKTLRQRTNDELCSTSNSDQLKHFKIGEELPLQSDYWSRWRARSLSYMLDKRTIRLISGASLICSAPEGHWTLVLERLNIPAANSDFCEMIELLLLGLVANRWNTLIEHLMSVSREFPAITKLFHEVNSLPLGKSQDLFMIEDLMNAKEKVVVDYLEVLLSSKVNQLWKISPVLAAVAIPSWSKLFKSYLHELQDQFIGNSLATRQCGCLTSAMEHKDCEVGERIWCLYIFHICGGTGTRRSVAYT